jgi:hypothetical protein
MGEEHAKRNPTELEIKVLQHIADEDEGNHSCWHALVNCVLVCKAWARHVRSQLYYAGNMNNLKGIVQFEYLCQCTHLWPFLREFTWPQKSSLYLSTSNPDIIKNVAPTVTKLRFRRVDHQYLEPWLKEYLSTFTNINELDMTGSTFESWTTVVRIVSGFPLLATLAMPCTSTFQDDDGPNGPKVLYPSPPSRLVHIKLASGCEAEMVSWICRGSPIPNIQTVEAESKIDSKVLARLLRLLDGSLWHLIIHIDSHMCFFFRLALSKLILIKNHSWRGYLGSTFILLLPHGKYCP